MAATKVMANMISCVINQDTLPDIQKMVSIDTGSLEMASEKGNLSPSLQRSVDHSTNESHQMMSRDHANVAVIWDPVENVEMLQKCGRCHVC